MAHSSGGTIPPDLLVISMPVVRMDMEAPAPGLGGSEGQ
jgi:hypothetical protein